MKRFQEMGLKAFSLPFLSRAKAAHPCRQPQGLESITPNQQNFISYLLERLNWDEKHYQNFSKRIIKRPDP